jgi:R67 dihydrofolate reductase
MTIQKPEGAKFDMGAYVEKIKGASRWRGEVVGYYITGEGEFGCAVHSAFHKGAIQIYPESVLELV